MAGWVAGFVPAALAGQQRLDDTPEHWPQVIGRVVDRDTGEPIRQARLLLESLDIETLTDDYGIFVFEGLPPGDYEMQLEHIGYGTQLARFDARPRSTSRLEIRLAPVAVALDPLNVQVTSEFRPWYLGNVGYFERQLRGWGVYFDPEYFERREGMIFRTFLQMSAFPNLRARSARCGTALLFTRSNQPPRLGRAGGCCAPLIYVDGRRDRVGLAPDLSMADIGAVEVYRDIAGAPIEAMDWGAANCGMVAIWTKRW